MEKKLAGKPAPETYEEVARMLGTLPEQAVVKEGAISGVQASRRGGFGLVIGGPEATTRRSSARATPILLSATLQNLA